MGQYVARRLLLMIPVLIGVSILVFLLARILPGDVFAAQSSSSGIDKATQDQLRKDAGLDRPLVVQYLDWAGHVLVGDFGESLYNRQDVGGQIKGAAPVTLELTLLATIIGLVVAIPAGVVSAITRGSAVDYLVRFAAVVGLSVPSYVLGTLAITYLALWFNWIPPSGYISVFDSPWQNFQQFVIPAVILGLGFAASIMRMTRSTVLGVLREDYVRTARAKGLRARIIIIRHVLRTSLLPVMTLVGAQVGFLLGGSVIVESIFALNGLGSVAVSAIQNRDYIMIQAVTLLAAVVFTMLNLLVDLSYGWLDPRIRLQ
ncbi:MAG TPA: ABC transporter permease [Gemmatimonadales bacterium]|nr:ABC transporter permease [Gemmatimonadales bacterium]